MAAGQTRLPTSALWRRTEIEIAVSNGVDLRQVFSRSICTCCCLHNFFHFESQRLCLLRVFFAHRCDATHKKRTKAGRPSSLWVWNSRPYFFALAIGTNPHVLSAVRRKRSQSCKRMPGNTRIQLLSHANFNFLYSLPRHFDVARCRV